MKRTRGVMGGPKRSMQYGSRCLVVWRGRGGGGRATVDHVPVCRVDCRTPFWILAVPWDKHELFFSLVHTSSAALAVTVLPLQPDQRTRPFIFGPPPKRTRLDPFFSHLHLSLSLIFFITGCASFQPRRRRRVPMWPRLLLR
jgi:hypothetical protein